MIDYEKFQMSLKHLEVQFENYRTLGDDQPDLIQEAVAESVIQRFETCWDCLWKLMNVLEKNRLTEVGQWPNPFALGRLRTNLLKLWRNWLRYAKERRGGGHLARLQRRKSQDALGPTEGFC